MVTCSAMLLLTSLSRPNVAEEASQSAHNGIYYSFIHTKIAGFWWWFFMYDFLGNHSVRFLPSVGYQIHVSVCMRFFPVFYGMWSDDGTFPAGVVVSGDFCLRI